MATNGPNTSLVVNEISIDEEFIDDGPKLKGEHRDIPNNVDDTDSTPLYENRVSIEKSNIDESKLIDSVSSCESSPVKTRVSISQPTTPIRTVNFNIVESASSSLEDFSTVLDNKGNVLRSRSQSFSGALEKMKKQRKKKEGEDDSKEKKKKKKDSTTWTPDKPDSPQKLSLSKLKTLGTFTTKKRVWNANEIVDNIYVGDEKAAADRDELKSRGITHVLSVIGNQPPHPSDFQYLILDCLDNVDHDLISHFPNTNEFIEQALQSGGKVIVHCHQGVSRSPTIVMAYMMAKLNFTFDKSIDHIATRRKVQPNYGFLTQLQLYEDMKHSLIGDSPHHLQYFQIKKSSMLADLRHKWAAQRDSWNGPYTGNIISSESSNTQVIQCTCGQILSHFSSLMTHDPHSSGTSCSVLYSHPYTWMGTLREEKGILKCDKCEEIVGEFSWESGVACNCGALFKPGFALYKERVREGEEEEIQKKELEKLVEEAVEIDTEIEGMMTERNILQELLEDVEEEDMEDEEEEKLRQQEKLQRQEEEKQRQEEEERQRLVEEEAERQRIAKEEEERQRLIQEEEERKRVAQEEEEKKRLALEEELERQRIAQEEAERQRQLEEERKRKAEEEEREKQRREEEERLRIAQELEKQRQEELERQAEEEEKARKAEEAERQRIALEEAEKQRIVQEQRRRREEEEAERHRKAEEERLRILKEEAEEQAELQRLAEEERNKIIEEKRLKEEEERLEFEREEAKIREEEQQEAKSKLTTPPLKKSLLKPLNSASPSNIPSPIKKTTSTSTSTTTTTKPATTTTVKPPITTKFTGFTKPVTVTKPVGHITKPVITIAPRTSDIKPAINGAPKRVVTAVPKPVPATKTTAVTVKKTVTTAPPVKKSATVTIPKPEIPITVESRDRSNSLPESVILVEEPIKHVPIAPNIRVAPLKVEEKVLNRTSSKSQIKSTVAVPAIKKTEIKTKVTTAADSKKPELKKIIEKKTTETKPRAETIEIKSAEVKTKTTETTEVKTAEVKAKTTETRAEKTEIKSAEVKTKTTEAEAKPKKLETKVETTSTKTVARTGSSASLLSKIPKPQSPSGIPKPNVVKKS